MSWASAGIFVLVSSLRKALMKTSPRRRRKAKWSIGTVPRWDTRLRELWVGPVLVKRLRVPAANQDRILTAFQAQGWPAVIDNPLRPDGDRDAVSQLQFTIRRLKGCQRERVIRFFGNGTGAVIGWRFETV